VDAAGLIYTALSHPRGTSVYFGLTKDSSKEAAWEPLLEVLSLAAIPHELSEHRLEIYFPNGSRIRLLGADMDNIKNRLRGRKFRLVIVDECAFYQTVDDLVLSVLLPTLSDYQAPLWMTSSPGILPSGLFYEADQGKLQENWLRSHWTLLDNPHFQQPSKNPKFKTLGEEELDTIVRMQYQGDWQNPTFRREYLGEWVFDDKSLVYTFTAKIDEEYHLRKQQYVLGFNFERNGTLGAVVVKFGEYDRTVQVVEAMEIIVNSVDDTAAEIEAAMEQYGTETAFCYLGDRDPEIIEEFKHRYQIPLQVSKYKKESFYQQIIAADMQNDYIECTPACEPLIQEFNTIVKDEHGDEIEGQKTLLADTFFSVYLHIYQTHLKTVEEEETEQQRMERELLERVRQEIEDHGALYGYEDSYYKNF
jgi:hypothetical protein